MAIKSQALRRGRDVKYALVALSIAILIALPWRLIRLMRKKLGCKPRILRGPRAMVGLSYNRKADQLYGYVSDIMVNRLDNFQYPYVFRSEFTYVISEWKGRPRLKALKPLVMLLTKYDIWVTFFDGKFLGGHPLGKYEGRLIRAAGVKIIAVPYGGDVQHFNGLHTRFDYVERLWKDYQNHYGDKDLHNRKVKGQVGYFSRNSDFVIAGDHSLTPFLPRFELNFKYFPIDCAVWNPSFETNNTTPLIVHAPNHRNVKGTDILLQACEKLKRKGLGFELVLVEGVPRNEVQHIYSRADIIADQFVMGAYGLTALEGMALGKPLLSYSSENQLRDPAFNLPYVNTNRDNIEDVLRVLIALPQLRVRLGVAGRRAVEQYQSIEAIGEVWDRIYRHLWFGEPLDLETTRVFSPERGARSLCEDPRKKEFWPVEVEDLMGDIRAALN